MKCLTAQEAREWCVQHSIPLDARGLPQPEFEDAEGRDFKIPLDAGARIGLLHELFEQIPAGEEVLVWFHDWSVWPSGQRWHMFHRFRASYGETRPIWDVPAQVFSPAEREDLISCAAFAILFLSDCHVVAATGDTWLFFSHDAIGWICRR
jgi:hypothetical protein